MYGVSRPRADIETPPENGVLKERKEWDSAVKRIKKAGLFPPYDQPKTWDCLAALGSILVRTNTDAVILDAGAEIYSTLLPWLYLFGYEKLLGINKSFSISSQRGPIRYEYADITDTAYQDEVFDAISCLSVIEHGVDLEKYFCEMSRILKVGGVLITSADYFDTKINTDNMVAYGTPVKVFSKRDILDALSIAEKYDLKLTSSIDYSCKEKVINWERLGLEFTFIIFTLEKIR